MEAPRLLPVSAEAQTLQHTHVNGSSSSSCPACQVAFPRMNAQEPEFKSAREVARPLTKRNCVCLALDKGKCKLGLGVGLGIGLIVGGAVIGSTAGTVLIVAGSICLIAIALWCIKERRDQKKTFQAMSWDLPESLPQSPSSSPLTEHFSYCT